MRFHCLVPLSAALAGVVISVLVIRQGARDRLHRSFGLAALATVGWNLDIFTLYYFEDPVAAEWWSGLFRVAVCLAPPLIFHFGLVLSGSTGRFWRWLLFGGYGLGALLALANLQGKLAAGVERHTWGWYPVPTRLYSVFTVFLVAYLLLWLERVWHSYRHPSSPRQRVQAKFWLLACLIQIPFVLTNLLPVYGVNVYPLGNVGNVLFTGIVAYAIVRHRLMDVDYVVRKGVSFCIASTVVLVPGAIGISALARAMEQDPTVVVCASISLALLAVIFVPTLQQALETRLHRALFPELYDYRLRMRQLAAGLAHILDQAQLVRRLGDELSDILDVERCDVFVEDERTGRLAPVYPASGPSAERLGDDIVKSLEGLSGPMLTSELEADLHPGSPLLRAREWEVVIPLRVKDRLTGLIGLGRNTEFRIFSSEDIELFGTVAAAASVALENASLSRQLRRSEVVLERANRLSSLGMLAAGIAHEIRNPLVAVKTFLDLLPQRLDDREFLSHFRDLSLGELRRVTDLIADLLALGKSKTAERRAVDLAPTLEPVVRLMESTARKRGVEVVSVFERGLPAVWADPDQLKQITLNLILNAIETSNAGGHVALDVRAQPDDGVVLEVRDDGPGIAPVQLETIFHPFFTTKETGTGLGLTLVHQMVVEHGGEITVESELGRGTIFRVTLPVAQLDLARTGT